MNHLPSSSAYHHPKEKLIVSSESVMAFIDRAIAEKLRQGAPLLIIGLGWDLWKPFRNEFDAFVRIPPGMTPRPAVALVVEIPARGYILVDDKDQVSRGEL
jgi:hypothetical protein